MIRFFSVDLNTDSMLPKLEGLSAPSLVVFPAFHKDRRRVSNGRADSSKIATEIDTLRVAKWLHKYTDLKFDLEPEFETTKKTK